MGKQKYKVIKVITLTSIITLTVIGGVKMIKLQQETKKEISDYEENQVSDSKDRTSQVNRAIAEIKEGNINSEEFKYNLLMLLDNRYEKKDIESLIDKTDSDNDGLPDQLEKIYGTNKNLEDTDGDGLTDGYEVTMTVTDPCLKDSDNNGILDNGEDPDDDGLTNGEEADYGTNPLVKDTDGDGLDDLKEIETYGTDPNKEDTDGDSLSDYTEIFVTKTNPLSPDSESEVVVKGDSSNSYAQLSMEVQGQAKNIWDLSILELPEASILSPDIISGMYGKAYDFSSLGEFNQCKVYIDILDNQSELEYGLFYFNENAGTFEEVANQSYDNGKLTAELQHFSKYVILDKKQQKTAEEDIRNFIEKAYEGDPNEDSDKDGFKNAVDPTPAKADFFASYNHYIRHFYGNNEVISVFVDQPVKGTKEIYNFLAGFDVGHTFMAYTNGDKEYYSGLYPYEAFKIEMLNGGDVSGKINTDEGIYKLIPNEPINNLVEYGDEFSYKKDYDIGHKWNVALPFNLENSLLQKYWDYPRNYAKLYNLKTNNCTTFVLDFLNDNGIKTSIYDGTYTPIVEESYYNFTGGTPGLTGYYIQNKYPITSVQNSKKWIKNEGVKDIYYSEMSQRLSINTDKSLENDYVSMTDKFMEYNGHYYGVIKVKNKDYRYKTEWDQAKATAEELGGYLAVITSEEEDNFCYNLAKDVYGIDSCYFGLSDAKSEGDWQWVNGEPLNYQNWQEGEPNNQGEKEHYGMYYYGFGSSKWNDGDDNDGVRVYLVEFDKKP